ncbi:hypothetical protein HPB48_015012 [Haemaphysalis longicornis]|uniref:HTH CENPB-type domain-containing protein n=1 Tax=Haemaphysalis longicornis TaxID=44386 RepID=A0A9J6GNX6_HAELO|nr:hypothetical protein HPB48_015012 [Haemaphysalis longicornis]
MDCCVVRRTFRNTERLPPNLPTQGVMAASAPDREKKGKGPRCFSKSRPPRLSVGPPNGVRDDPKSEDRQWGNPGTALDGPVRCVLQLLVEPRRPEDEGEVGPQLASRVLASFGSLAKQLRADLYRVGREGQHYFDPRHAVNRGHHHQDSGSASPPQVSSSTSPPLHASEGGVAEARGAEGDGPRITRPQRPPVARGTVVMAGPPWGQPGALPPAFVPHALQGGPFVGHGLVWDPLRYCLYRVSANCGPRGTVERAVFKWFLDTRAVNMPVSGALLQRKARDFACIMGYDSFLASSGWLQRFKERHDIQRRQRGRKKTLGGC